MSNNLLDQIINKLTTDGIIGGSTGWVGQKSLLTPEPDKLVVVYDTGGLPADIVKSSETKYDQPTFQVRVRSTAFDYQGARDKMQDVFNSLHSNEPVAASGDPKFVYMYCQNSAPLPLGLDDQNRPGMTLNFRCMREHGA